MNNTHAQTNAPKALAPEQQEQKEQQEHAELCARMQHALRDLRAGKIVVVTDDDDRENEGDFIALSDRITPDTVNLIITEGRGLLCQAITPERAREMKLEPMVSHNTALHSTAFTASVDAIKGCTTGISSSDRAITVRTLADPESAPEDLSRPGHIFPLVAAPGGLSERRGHTEAAVALAQLCGALPSSVLCEILDEDGTMARGSRLSAIAERLGMPEISIQDIIEYEATVSNEPEVVETARAMVPTRFGRFQMRVYADAAGREQEPFVLIPESFLSELESYTGTASIAHSKRDTTKGQPAPLVRVHSECLTGECLASLRCECGPQLDEAMRRVQAEGGLVVYLRQEGRGIGLTDKIRAYALQDAGLDTYEANTALGLQADGRSYSVAAEILQEIGLTQLRLLTNNPDKIHGLEHGGITVTERVPLIMETTRENQAYIRTKQEKFGHLMDEQMEDKNDHSGN